MDITRRAKIRGIQWWLLLHEDLWPNFEGPGEVKYTLAEEHDEENTSSAARSIKSSRVSERSGSHKKMQSYKKHCHAWRGLKKVVMVMIYLDST